MNKMKNHFKQTVASLLLSNLLLASCHVNKSAINLIEPVDNQLSATKEKAHALTASQLIEELLYADGNLAASGNEYGPCPLSIAEDLLLNLEKLCISNTSKLAYAYLTSPSSSKMQQPLIFTPKQAGVQSHTKSSPQGLSYVSHHELTQLVGSPLGWMSYEGHQLYKLYYLPNGELYAVVYDKGDTNLVQLLSIYVMPEVNLNDIAEYSPKERVRYLHITLNRSSTQGTVFIVQAEILGGGRDKKKE